MRCENSTLLCIQWPQILYMSILSTLGVSISNEISERETVVGETNHVKAVNTFSTCNGMHIDAVSTIKLQCRF